MTGKEANDAPQRARGLPRIIDSISTTERLKVFSPSQNSRALAFSLAKTTLSDTHGAGGFARPGSFFRRPGSPNALPGRSLLK